MIQENQKYKFLEFAEKKGKVYWSDITAFLGREILETKDFDYILKKLDKMDIKVVNDMLEQPAPSKPQDNYIKTLSFLKKKITPEIESDTLCLISLFDLAIAKNNSITCIDIQNTVGLDNALSEPEKFRNTVKILLKANIIIQDLKVRKNGYFQFPFVYGDKLFADYENFTDDHMIKLRKRAGREDIDTDSREKFNSDFRSYIANAIIDNISDIEEVVVKYKIPEKNLKDWIFVEENGYDAVDPKEILDDEYLIDEIKTGRRQGYTIDDLAARYETYPSVIKSVLSDGTWYYKIEDEEQETIGDRLAKSY